VAGDFSEAVPHGADAYLLRWIVNDWDDEAAIKILTDCRTAMVSAGKVLLVETVIPEGTVGSDATRVTPRCWYWQLKRTEVSIETCFNAQS
jgi:hypothetical protein